jgi:hypothetical protein
MKSKSILGAGFALLFITFGATAGTVTLDRIYYNFPLAGGGGGATGTLNGVPIEMFCDDFSNDIGAGNSYSANVTPLSTSANLSETRFGGISSTGWTTINISDGNTSLDMLDNAFFNSGPGTSSLARYEMAAYLVSLFNMSLGNNTTNNEIQEAMWSILDPKTIAPYNPAGVNDAAYLEQAASWYNGISTNQTALNTFLSQFEIVSPANMTFSNGRGIGGFQEQIVQTPEPRGGVWVILSLLVGGFLVIRRNRNRRAADIQPVAV